MTVRTVATRSPFSVRAVCRREGEKGDPPIARDRLIVPWAPLLSDATIAAPVTVPDLSGGDPVRGQALFSGDQARCAQCHVFRGQGGKVGPDLTGVGRKGRAEIYRSLAVPSAAIEPDYTSYTIATKSGQVLVGVIRAEGPDTIKVTDTNAHDTILHRDEIQETPAERDVDHAPRVGRCPGRRGRARPHRLPDLTRAVDDGQTPAPPSDPSGRGDPGFRSCSVPIV